MSERNDIPRPGPASDDGAGIDDDDCIIGSRGERVRARHAEIRPSADDIERFWLGVDSSGGADACWEWTKARHQNGYGATTIGGAAVKAHRASWVIAHGPIPGGMLVCHRCDNPPCCNPAHLFLGTDSDNIEDCRRKGRKPAGDASAPHRFPEKYRGENAGNARLTEHDVVEIRRLLDEGTSRESIQARFGIVSSHVSRIALGLSWQHLNTEAEAERAERFRDQRQKGEHNNAAKLDWQTVGEIRAIYASGDATQQALAERYHVSQHAISALIRGETWVNTPGGSEKSIDSDKMVPCGQCLGHGWLLLPFGATVDCPLCRASGWVSDLLASQLQRQGT